MANTKNESVANGKSPSSEDSAPGPPDGGWGWVVTFSSFMISFLVDGVCFTFGLLFTEFLEYFGESKGKTSLLGSVLNGAYLSLGRTRFLLFLNLFIVQTKYMYLWLCYLIHCMHYHTLKTVLLADWKGNARRIKKNYLKYILRCFNVFALKWFRQIVQKIIVVSTAELVSHITACYLACHI